MLNVITPQMNLPESRFDACKLTYCNTNGVLHALREDAVGAYYCPPRACITDIAGMARAASGRVLILYIDGLGYDLCRRACLPYIKQQFRIQVARSIFPPLTQPAMASILTGVTPDKHGVHSRRDHRVQCPSLLALSGAVLIEADSAPLCLEVPPQLTLPDQYGNADQPVFDQTKAALAQGSPLVIAHFHGLDDMEHDHGDDLHYVQAKLTELDGYVQLLCDGFEGITILCSDHGVHSDAKGGSHGQFDYRDMFVPLGVKI